ncbi:MAG: hypothetical protein LUD17_03215 [Bacteroidales bacterium]|nr:hypothetical protein [Bacteroidales bacterium]
MHGFTSSGQCPIVEALCEELKDEAEVIAPDLPLHPKDALAEIAKEIERWSPDLIVGSSCGGYYAMPFITKKIKAILINPQKTMVPFLEQRIGVREYKSPRKDKHQSYEVTHALIEEFKNLEMPDSRSVPQDSVYVLLGSNDPLRQWRNEDFDHLIPFPGSHTMAPAQVRTHLAPLCRQVLFQ